MHPHRFAPPSDADLADARALNALRAAGASSRRERLEGRLAAGLACDRHLAVYGSLAPGRANAAQLEGLAGEWLEGCAVTGTLIDRGWGAGIGFPALDWSPSGARVPVQVLVSRDLPPHWERLDAFEGPEYLRIVVPLWADERIVGLANLYALHP